MSKYTWAKGLIPLILSFILVSTASAQDDLLKHVTLKQYPPGSFRVKYGGIRGFINNQVISQFHAFHRDWIDIKYIDDPIAASEELYQIRQAQRDINNGGAWFTRRWWESLPEDKGGAPTRPISVYRGRVRNIIDFGVAYITSDFRFRWREYRVNLTKLLTPRSHKFISHHQWNIRFRPRASFSSATIVRSAAASAVFEYSYRGIRLIEISLFIRYSIILRAIYSGISFSLLRW